MTYSNEETSPLLDRLRTSVVEKVEVGESIGPHELRTVTGGKVVIPSGSELTHLQFRRFAGCPVCNLHLRSIVNRYDEINAAGIREVVFFHSRESDLIRYVEDLPFEIIADPSKKFYREFGVEAGYRAMLAPAAWLPILRALIRSSVRVLLRREHSPSLNPYGGRYGLPADFLVDTDGRVLAYKYGSHVYDQWSVDELLALARAAHRNSE